MGRIGRLSELVTDLHVNHGAPQTIANVQFHQVLGNKLLNREDSVRRIFASHLLDVRLSNFQLSWGRSFFVRSMPVSHSTSVFPTIQATAAPPLRIQLWDVIKWHAAELAAM